jgi:hypothetical protein
VRRFCSLPSLGVANPVASCYLKFMKTLWIALPLFVGGLSSCDKAKLAVEAARVKMSGVTDPGAPAEPGGDVDAALASQVDTAAEGVRFRRDLSFPGDLKVRIVNRRTFKNVRILSSSALGSEAMSYSGTWEDVASVELGGGQLSIALEKSGEVNELNPRKDAEKATGPEKERLPVTGVGTAGSQLRFLQGPDGWRAPETKGAVEFGNMILEREIRPSLPQLLATHGVRPRTQWFSSSRRWIGGDKLVLEGKSMALLFPGKTGGKVILTYEAAEALEGHPCGRFSIQGDVSLKGDVSLTGETSNTEMTIRSGKIWCSLIHPLVLREDYEGVKTSEMGSGQGPKLRIQGEVHQVIAREWTP